MKQEEKNLVDDGHTPLNPIEEFFIAQEGANSKYSELFKGNDKFIDQMTELSDKDIRDILVLQTNDKYLLGRGIDPIFGFYTHKFMRLMVSRNRKSREEYVNVHKADEMVDQLGRLRGVGGMP